MQESDEITKLIDEISFRKSNSKNYEKMGIQESFKKIEEFKNIQNNQDLEKYAKMICKNITQREITQIQEIYLKKIDKEFLNSK